MKKIHFYKETNLVYSVWANDVEDVKLTPLDYYEEYTTDMLISDTEYKHPILENKTLREMTREELISQGIEIELGEGEVVVNKKLITTPKPSAYHYWFNGKWIVNLDEVKNLKRDELKAVRDEKIHSNIEVHGEVFQVRAGDMEHFDDAERAVTRNVKKPTDIRYWILADNSIKPFTYEQIRQVLDAKALRKEQVFIKFGELSMKLEKAQSIEEIEAIVWEE